ncbi:hypothetical protein LTR36_001116 [Oleoguttula mirabilis]|uniref:Major facilitator superfamily (MFS) profile domain-containing protein n=1 Tax=Oleoguttula mirabilis TaxID=1507867 RepID=A0AAV9JR51_9PEZI|nr:hypothetical protein LTR36_001116 [Oleoguttula mirabilis]
MELGDRAGREETMGRNPDVEDGTEPTEVTGQEQQPRDALPPTDGGYQAWLVLAGCFVINVFIWGFAFSFGVLQEYYTTHEPFASSPQGIPAIGTTATGLMYLLMPVYFLGLQRWPVLKRYSTWASLPVVAAALIGASFAQTVTQLIATQGVLYALGGNMLVAPTVTYLDEWFVRKKGLAIGIMWAGDGAGGVIMPIVLQALLSRYGFRVALRCIACAFVVLMAPLLVFTKARLPVPAASAVRPINTSFLMSPVFWVLQAFNVIQGTGYFLPSNYLPTYAQSIGLSSKFGSLTLVMVNLAAALGCVLTGALVDRVDVTAVILAISVGGAAAILAVWGVSTSIAPLCVFSLLYGVTAGSYSTTWAGMIKDVQRHDVNADANLVFGFLAAGRGVGAVVSGPLSAALIDSSGEATQGYGGAYRFLVVFAGCTTLVGGSSWFVRKAGWI